MAENVNIDYDENSPIIVEVSILNEQTPVEVHVDLNSAQQAADAAQQAQDALSQIQALYNSGIIAKGTITRVDNVFTFSVGFIWKINNITYQNNAPIVLTVPHATAGKYRISSAILNTSNSITLVSGAEDDTEAQAPEIPAGTILLTSWNVFGPEVSDPQEPITGDLFVKKEEFAENYVTGSSAISLVLNSEQTAFRLTSNAITVVEGTAPTTQYISSFGYTGKIITIINATASNKTIKHSLDSWCFRFPDANDLILGPNEVLTMRQTKTTTPYFDMICVGRVVASGGGGSQDLQQTLENGATFTANGKTLTIYSDVISIFDNNNLSTLEIGMGDAPDNPIFIVYTTNAGSQTELLFPKTETTENVAYQSYVDTATTSAKTEAEAYADGLFDTLVGASPIDLDTIQEISAALQNNPDVIAELMTALGNRLRFDINNQGLSSTEKANALANLGIVVADLLNRANHTGTQAISTVLGLQTYLNKINSGIISSAEKPLVNTTSAQAIYDTDLNAEANCTYKIFGLADFTGLATVGSYLAFHLLGTATIDSFNIMTIAVKNNNNATPSLTVVNSNGTQITSSSAISTARLIFFGEVRVSGAGTVKPSIAFSSATGSMKVSANAEFSHNKIGSNTVTTF